MCSLVRSRSLVPICSKFWAFNNALEAALAALMSYNQNGDEDAENWSEGESEEFEGEEDSSFVTWFCNARGHEFYCKIDEDYIADNFNMFGLKPLFPHYQQALSEILDQDWMEGCSDHHVEEVYAAAGELYGLIHARFITTPFGLAEMSRKFASATFGTCPRVLCQNQGGQNQAVLPIGLSDEPKKSYVKLFCPRCQGVFDPPRKQHRTIDGAHFGTTMAHLVMLEHPQPIPPVVKFQPKVFGFKLREESKCVVRAGPAAQPRLPFCHASTSIVGSAHPTVDGKF